MPLLTLLWWMLYSEGFVSSLGLEWMTFFLLGHIEKCSVTSCPVYFSSAFINNSWQWSSLHAVDRELNPVSNMQDNKCCTISRPRKRITVACPETPKPGELLRKRNITLDLIHSRLCYLLIKLRGWKNHHSDFIPREVMAKHHLTIGTRLNSR